MSIETPLPAANGAAPVEQHEGANGTVKLENGIAGLKVDAQAQLEQAGAQGQTQAAGSPVPEIELHRACLGGNVEEVRGVLSKGLESLEQLGGFFW